MNMICLDVEGVLLPEIWKFIATKTNISELELTTRDEPDYEKLMNHRIEIIRKNNLSFNDLVAFAESVEPLSGAFDFLSSLREDFQVSLISDSYYEFLQPLSHKLGNPSIFCHHLLSDENNNFTGWKPRLIDQKPKCVNAFQSLGFKVFAAGDSFNDIGMLNVADFSAFIHAPTHISKMHKTIPSFGNYVDLEKFIRRSLN